MHVTRTKICSKIDNSLHLQRKIRPHLTNQLHIGGERVSLKEEERRIGKREEEESNSVVGKRMASGEGGGDTGENEIGKGNSNTGVCVEVTHYWLGKMCSHFLLVTGLQGQRWSPRPHLQTEGAILEGT